MGKSETQPSTSNANLTVDDDFVANFHFVVHSRVQDDGEIKSWIRVSQKYFPVVIMSKTYK